VIVALVSGGLPLVALVAGVVGAAVVGVVVRVTHRGVGTVFGWLLLPLGSLGRALLPLAFVVLVILCFATAQVGLALQIASGLGLALLGWVFAHKEGPLGFERMQLADLRETASRKMRKNGKPPPVVLTARDAAVPLVALGIALVVVFGLLGALERWHDLRPVRDASAVLVWVAVLALLFAICFRLVGYVTSWWRLGVALVLGLLLWRELAWAGVLRGGHLLSWAPPVWSALAALGLVAVLLLVEGVSRPDGPTPPSDGHRITRATGFLLAVVSAAFMFGGLFVAALVIAHGATPLVGTNDRLPTVRPTTVRLTGDRDLDLAWTYVPVLRLHHEEQYAPIAVEKFLEHATSRGAEGDGTGRTVSLSTLPSRCADAAQERCAYLDCRTCIDRKRKTQPTGYAAQGVFYARVVRRRDEPHAFAGWNPWGRSLDVLIQYWIFYGYDSWQSATPVGVLTQEHQGDWEHVTVGLTVGAAGPGTPQRTTPRFVALSAHCGGQVVDWLNVHAAYAAPATEPDPVTNAPHLVFTDTPLEPRDELSHPIVAVAKGSHANYALSSDRRPPDWGSCNNLPNQLIEAFSYGSNIRDVTDSDNTGWYAYPHGIALATATTAPMDYPGTWSPIETVTFGRGDKHRVGAGPPSPPLQGQIWSTPLHSYFCGPRWRPRGSPPAGHPALHGTDGQC
jgi:hypothetical protein